MCTHWALARKTDFELFACLIFRSAATKRCFPLPLFFYRTTSENTEIPSTTTKCVAFNCQSPSFRRFRWILNLVRLSRRNWPYTYDVAFCYSALPQRISSFFTDWVMFLWVFFERHLFLTITWRIWDGTRRHARDL